MLLSLGSNIEPEKHLLAAVSLLSQRLEIVAASRVFETEPAGSSSGPQFLNAAVEILCDLGPSVLKHEVLRPVEEELGRIRSADRNAPRTIDLDISLYSLTVIHDPSADLEIPDPEILTRAHVAIPLADVSPRALHPVEGLTLERIAQRFENRGVRVHSELALWPQSDRL